MSDSSRAELSIDGLLKRAAASHQSGNLVTAEGLYRKILEREPEHADALHLLGLAVFHRGRVEEADSLISRAILKDDKRAYFHNNLGEVRRSAGDASGSEACYRRAIDIDPSYAQAHNNLGLALEQLGRSGEAEAAFLKALEINPASAEAHNNLGIARQSVGRLDDAIESFRRSLELDPRHAEARNNLGAALKIRGELDESARVLEEAVRMRPDLARAHYNLASVRLAKGEFEAAERACRQAIELSPGEADFHNNLGHILRQQGQLDAAVESLEKALEIDPGHATALNDLGVILLVRGRFGDSADYFRRALESDPGLAIACENLARTRRFGPGDAEDLALLQSRLESGDLDARGLTHIHFAIGKIRDDLGEYDEAFEHIRKANTLKRASVDFDAAAQARFVNETIDLYDRDFMNKLGEFANPSETPVLIIGMPRSGTTLVEQILASHADVHGGGEIDYFRDCARILPSRLDQAQGYPLCLKALDAGSAQALADGYRERLEQNAWDAVRVSDKMPLNFEHLGLIAALFPNARIIHCRRNSVDVGLSIYFQHFARDLPFAYDLEDIAAYTRQYERLMAHWRTLFPERLFEIEYERLVESTEELSRALVSHCGLAWDEACLRHYETDRLVGTASHWQVRQPVYSGSVSRFKRYEKHLGPLMGAAGGAGAAGS